MFYENINSASVNYPFLVHHNNVKYIPHLHDETEIVFVEDGEIEFTLDHNITVLKKGEIAVIPCKEIHNLYTKTRSKTFVIKLFPIINIEEIKLKKYILSENDENYSEIFKLIQNIINEDKAKNSEYELAVNICSRQIFLFILRHLKQMSLNSRDKIRMHKESNFLNNVNAYLEENYKKNIGLENVSNYLGLTKSYFCRYFKNITGTSFWNYYTLFRLEKAIKLIENDEHENLISIALECGFNNVRSFNKAFKEYYLKTPSEYKKRYRENETHH